MTKAIAVSRKAPLLLLALKDGEANEFFPSSFVKSTKDMLINMSLNFARQYTSIVYADQLDKACKIVLGVANLGLMTKANGDIDKAKTVLLNDGVKGCFQLGWSFVGNLLSYSPRFNGQDTLTYFSLETDSTDDIRNVYSDLYNQMQSEIIAVKLDSQIVSKFYPPHYRINDEQEYIPAHSPNHVFTVVLRGLVGNVEENRGHLTKKEVISLVKLVLSKSMVELSTELENNDQINQVRQRLTKDVRADYNRLIDDIPGIVFQEIKKMAEQNDSQLYVAFMVSGMGAIDVSDEVSVDLASELSQSDRDFAGLDDGDYFTGVGSTFVLPIFLFKNFVNIIK